MKKVMRWAILRIIWVMDPESAYRNHPLPTLSSIRCCSIVTGMFWAGTACIPIRMVPVMPSLGWEVYGLRILPCLSMALLDMEVGGLPVRQEMREGPLFLPVLHLPVFV
jgi:hypothetical protein